MRGWLLGLALVACGAPPVDAGPAADGGLGPARPLGMLLGTGPRGAFTPVEAGDELRLQRGCQGSQHIFTSLRLANLAEGLVRVRVTVVRADDGEVVSVPIDVRLPPEADPLQQPRAGLVTGLTPVIEVPRDVLDRAVEVRVTVDDEGGASASGVLRGVVRWGADSCGGHG